jgi:hypothetical protein
MVVLEELLAARAVTMPVRKNYMSEHIHPDVEQQAAVPETPDRGRACWVRTRNRVVVVLL